jgi:hypothetical protein
MTTLNHGNVVLLVRLLLGNVVTMTVEAMNLMMPLLQEVQHLGLEIVDVEGRDAATPFTVARMATMLQQHPPLLLGNNKIPPATPLQHPVHTLVMPHRGTTLLTLKEVWVHHLVSPPLLD